MNSTNNGRYQFGPFLLDGKERLLLRDGQQITLTPKAFDILLLLVENTGHVLTKEEMLTRLWPDTFVEEANLTNNISILRRALGDDSEGQQYIKTVPRLGYRFVAAVNQSQSVADDQSKRLPLFGKRRRIALTIASAAVLLFLITGGLVMRARLSRPPKAPLAFGERDWVLIADFDNRTGEPLFDGTIESALERELSNSRFVNVISPERSGDVLRLMRKPPETKIDAQLGREICLRDGGTRALITGRVEKLGTTYLMSVNLVDPLRNQIIASATEEAANQQNVWPAIRRLSNWTRETLGETLPSIQQSSAALEKVTTPSLRALQLYTQAMPLVNQFKWGPAEQVLKQAMTEDPEFASAHIMLAHMIRYQRKAEKEWGPSAQRALELSERTSQRERYFIQGSYYQILRRDYEKAVASYEALVRQYPDDFWGHNNLAWAYFSLGRWRESATQLAQAAELRPNDVRINRMAAWDLIQYDMAEARRVVQRTAKVITPEMTPAQPGDFAWIQLFYVHDLWTRGEVVLALDELDRWARTIDALDGSQKDAFAKNIGHCYLSFGKGKAAEEIFQKMSASNTSRRAFLAEAAYTSGDSRKLKNHLREWLNSKLEGEFPFFLLIRAGLKAEAQRMLAKQKASLPPEDLPNKAIYKVMEGEIALAQGETTKAITTHSGRTAWGQVEW
jgi:DNA-binding winged helix-turn-helix (wHTH) protein/tetratricopeptide (TPR) repeat protein